MNDEIRNLRLACFGAKRRAQRIVNKIKNKYTAPIWAEAMEKKSYRIGVYGAYRRSALRVVSALRTVSMDTALVIAGMLSLRMLVEVGRKKYLARRTT